MAKSQQRRARSASRAAASDGDASDAGGRSGADGNGQDPVRANLDAFRDALARGVISPLNLVMLTRDRMQEALDDAVERGRITRDDANALVQDLVRRGRKQTEDVLADLEELLDRSRDELGSAAGLVRSATPGVDHVVRGVERAKRGAGLHRGLPIEGYDDLTAAKVIDRLDGLSAADLRRIRDHERRHANRVSVLRAVERKLG